jgi:UDP-glucose 4-epimerase
MTEIKLPKRKNIAIKNPSSWLITGGCGFIGTSLINYLLKNCVTEKIRVLDNLSVGTIEDLTAVCDVIRKDPLELDSKTVFDNLPSGKVELVVGDICDSALVNLVCREIDVIVHLAANTGVAPSVEAPKKDMENNIIGTFNMLEGARANGVDHFIFASSGAPVGEIDPPIKENIAPKPVSPYGASKLAGEGYCSAYYRTYGIKTVALRFGNVYGPSSLHKDSVVARFVKRAIAGENLEIYGDGNQTRDFVYIDDLLEAICCAVQSNIGGEIFQIATQKGTSINELVSVLKKIMESHIPNLTIRIKNTRPRKGDVKQNYSDTSKAKDMLGWRSKWPLVTGLEHTLAWFLKNNKCNPITLSSGEDSFVK